MTDGNGPRSSSGRGRRKEFRLNPRERGFIMHGDPGTDRPSRLKRKIRDKRDSLSSRLHELLLDIEHFDHGEYFEPQVWKGGWLDLFGADRVEELDDQFVRFGRDLGQMVRRLMLYPSNAKKEDVWIDIIFGFIDGLCYDFGDEGHVDRKEFMDSILEGVDQRSKRTFDERATEAQDWFEEWNQQQNDRARSVQKATDILEGEDVEYTERMAEEVVSTLDGGYGQISPDVITRERVMNVVEVRNLKAKYHLLEQVKADIRRLDETEYDGISPLDFIDNMPRDTFETRTTREIKEKIGSDALNNVVAVAWYLVGENEIDGGVWNGDELVEIVEDNGWGKREYRLTEYGALLRHAHIHGSHSVVSLHGQELFESQLSTVLQELRLKGEI